VKKKSSEEGVISPAGIFKKTDLPGNCVICAFHNILKNLASKKLIIPSGDIAVEGYGISPVYIQKKDNKEIALTPLPLGSPLAVILLEGLIYSGGKKFIVCGSAGVLDENIEKGGLVIPDGAYSDEGTSGHYSNEKILKPSAAAVKILEKVCREKGIRYSKGLTWTTDAVLRETPSKIKQMREMGCISVDMEVSALFSAAQFRGAELAALLRGIDLVRETGWDKRKEEKPAYSAQSVLNIAVEACLKL